MQELHQLQQENSSLEIKIKELTTSHNELLLLRKDIQKLQQTNEINNSIAVVLLVKYSKNYIHSMTGYLLVFLQFDQQPVLSCEESSPFKPISYDNILVLYLLFLLSVFISLLVLAIEKSFKCFVKK